MLDSLLEVKKWTTNAGTKITESFMMMAILKKYAMIAERFFPQQTPIIIIMISMMVNIKLEDKWENSRLERSFFLDLRLTALI